MLVMRRIFLDTALCRVVVARPTVPAYGDTVDWG